MNDFNKLIAMIEELAGGKEFVLGDLRRDGNTIYIELNEVPKELIKEI